ncbi:MAG: S9 family peptidase [Kangiellaceae bacterium]
MRKPIVKSVILTLLIGSLMACSDSTQEAPKSMKPNQDNNNPPIAKKVDHIMSIHGYERNDPYYWLRDDKREKQDVLQYLNAENEYTQNKLAHTEELQQKLYQEMTSRLEPNEESVPVFEKGYWYSSVYKEGKDYPVHIRQKENLSAPQEILLDENQRAEGFEYYRLAGVELSSDLNLLAISEDTVSRRLYEIRIKNLTTGEFYPDVIKNTSGQIVWANDNQTIFYVKKNATTLLPFQVYRHQLGTSQQEDVLVYQEDDAEYYTAIYKARSEKYIVMGNYATDSTEIRVIEADSPKQDFQLFLAREDEHAFEVEHINDHFYILSDFQAPNERIWKVEQEKIGNKQHWQEILQHRDDTLIQSFELFSNHMVTSERVNGVEKLRIRDLHGKLLDEIKFNDAAYDVSFGDNPEPASNQFRYLYSSLTTPDSTYDYDTTTKTSQLKKQDTVIGDFRPEHYLSERIMIEARDGTKVPVSIVYRKDKFKKDGSNPLLNYAYGSYGATIDPNFSSARLSLLDRGFVFAISHIRGGKMLGRQWYEDGKKLNKMNTFTDFNDATQSLVKQGYGDPKKVYALGGSAGGMLMGGIINMQPELYHGVIAAVPFVDVVTTMLDESIPLTTGEFNEWGNPQDKKFYEYLLSYSPYDQVKKQDYPHLLVTTGLHDSQVQYWEPAKWVAKLRDMKTDNNLLLLETDMEVGHGGKSGRYKSYRDEAKRFAFLLDLAEIRE